MQTVFSLDKAIATFEPDRDLSTRAFVDVTSDITYKQRKSIPPEYLRVGGWEHQLIPVSTAFG